MNTPVPTRGLLLPPPDLAPEQGTPFVVGKTNCLSRESSTGAPVNHYKDKALRWPVASPRAGRGTGDSTAVFRPPSCLELSGEGWGSGCERQPPLWSDSSFTWPLLPITQGARPFPEERAARSEPLCSSEAGSHPRPRRKTKRQGRPGWGRAATAGMGGEKASLLWGGQGESSGVDRGAAMNSKAHADHPGVERGAQLQPLHRAHRTAFLPRPRDRGPQACRKRLKAL